MELVGLFMGAWMRESQEGMLLVSVKVAKSVQSEGAGEAITYLLYVDQTAHLPPL